MARSKALLGAGARLSDYLSASWLPLVWCRPMLCTKC